MAVKYMNSFGHSHVMNSLARTRNDGIQKILRNSFYSGQETEHASKIEQQIERQRKTERAKHIERQTARGERRRGNKERDFICKRDRNRTNK